MKNVWTFIVLLYTPALWSQPDVFTFSIDSLSNRDYFTLDLVDQWYFHQGSNPEWANTSIDLSEWERLSPQDLNASYADGTGRIEGWFRLKLKIDQSLEGKAIFFHKLSHDAVEIFVDGVLQTVYGEIGEDRKSTQAFNRNETLPRPANIQPGSIHSIAIHVVDYTIMHPARLRSRLAQGFPFLGITDQAYFNERALHWQRYPIFKAVMLSVAGLLSFLFWFLANQSTREKSLKLVAIGGSLLFISLLFQTLSELPNLTFTWWWLLLSSFFLSVFCSMAYIPIVVSHILQGSILRWVKVMSLAIVTLGIINVCIIYEVWPMMIAVVCCFCASIYITWSNWKQLHGSQWAIVIGILTTTFFVLALVFLATKGIETGNTVSPTLIHITTTGVFLAFPLSMAVYMVRRFKEMFEEVQEKSRRIALIAEEKEAILNQQNQTLEKEVNKRTAELNNSLEKLKSTQAQLIHSEKMASLGELTAGIAHEIQNPLNFVNNFSEVSTELMEEIREELKSGNPQEVEDILSDLAQNLQKINHHGGRASAIVRGMLDHSRATSDEKALTDINELCDEYLRLAYHGLRAKNKSFQANFRLEADPNLPEIMVVPQDIGRVLLNLINNAFQAVSSETLAKEDGDYQAEVIVFTRKLENGIEISVSDNGPGIPEEIKDKIFQPFFTTKPTGQGTGLGLSLAYDIVKSYGGKLTVHNNRGGGSEFTIILPTI